MGLYSRADLERDLDALDRLDAQLSRDVAAGDLTGFQLIHFQAEIERKRRRLRMKLLNSGQLVQDLRHAKRQVQAATTEHAKKRAEKELRSAFNMIRYNSDGQKSEYVVQEPPKLAKPVFREVSTISLAGQIEAREAQRAGKRVIWRPGGRDCARIIEQEATEVTE